MFPYRVEYTESESDIQNNDLFCKNTKNTKTLSKLWKVFEQIKKIKFLFCIMYKFHNSYFVFWGLFVNLGIFVYFVYFISC